MKEKVKGVHLKKLLTIWEGEETDQVNEAKTETHSNATEDLFLSLALSGERLCMTGRFGQAVSAFQTALAISTENTHVLKAVYNQLANAYFCLGEFRMSARYHYYDIRLCRAYKDRTGEGKALLNLSMSLLKLGHSDSALKCCRRAVALDPRLKTSALKATAKILTAKATRLLGHGEVEAEDLWIETLNGNRSGKDLPMAISALLEKAASLYLHLWSSMGVASARHAYLALMYAVGRFHEADHMRWKWEDEDEDELPAAELKPQSISKEETGWVSEAAHV